MKALKFFAIGLVEAVVGTVVFGASICIGMVYNVIYSLFMSITLKDWKAFPRFWGNVVGGLFIFAGRILHRFAIAIDIYANVNGEWLEDVVTHKEDTTFGEPNTTISASIGKLEIDGKLNKIGKGLSKALNFAFWQKAHAKDSWNYKIAHDKMVEEFFDKYK